MALEVKNSSTKAGDVRVPSLGQEDPRGHGKPLSILAWRIPWTEEPGGLQSREPQRARRDLIYIQVPSISPVPGNKKILLK